MKRVLNVILLLILAGAGLYVAYRAKLIPDPFNREPAPSSTPAPVLIQRDTLRVAVAKRPEKLLMASLRRLLAVENHKLELVEYSPQNVWLELAAGEIDVVIAPLGEAVKAQGRFQPGIFLVFSGESVGLDQLVAWPDQKAERVAVQQEAATDFLARQLLPEATIVPASSAQELEGWLQGKAVQAALIDTSANTRGLADSFKVLAGTSAEQPMPSVVVLSKVFAENAQKQEYTSRRDTLVASLRSWNGLIGYLDTQPELLKSTLRTEATEMGVDLDRLLEGYRFLTPARGREALLNFQAQDSFKQTLELLVLSGVSNLTGPDWESTVEAPAFLEPSWTLDVAAQPQPSPTPEVSPSASPETSATPTVSAPPARLAATYHYPDESIVLPWQEPALKGSTRDASIQTPALSQKAILVATNGHLVVHSFNEKKPEKIELTSPLTTPPISDNRNFYYAVQGRIAAVNSQGKEIWGLDVQGSPLGATAVVEEKLLYALETEQGGRLLCLDLLDGEILWEQTFDNPPATGPVVGNLEIGFAVVVLDQSGQARAFTLENGANLWTHGLNEPSFLPPAVGFGKVAINYPSGEVVLLSLAEGKREWKAQLGSALAAPPTLTRSGVLVPSKDTYLYMLSLQSGDIAWKTRLSQPLSEPAVVVGSQIVQSDESGKVHTLAADGSLTSTTEVSNSWLSRVVALDGRWALTDSAGEYRVFKNP